MHGLTSPKAGRAHTASVALVMSQLTSRIISRGALTPRSSDSTSFGLCSARTGPGRRTSQPTCVAKHVRSASASQHRAPRARTRQTAPKSPETAMKWSRPWAMWSTRVSSRRVWPRLSCDASTSSMCAVSVTCTVSPGRTRSCARRRQWLPELVLPEFRNVLLAVIASIRSHDGPGARISERAQANGEQTLTGPHCRILGDKTEGACYLRMFINTLRSEAPTTDLRYVLCRYSVPRASARQASCTFEIYEVSEQKMAVSVATETEGHARQLGKVHIRWRHHDARPFLHILDARDVPPDPLHKRLVLRGADHRKLKVRVRAEMGAEKSPIRARRRHEWSAYIRRPRERLRRTSSSNSADTGRWSLMVMVEWHAYAVCFTVTASDVMCRMRSVHAGLRLSGRRGGRGRSTGFKPQEGAVGIEFEARTSRRSQACHSGRQH